MSTWRHCVTPVRVGVPDTRPTSSRSIRDLPLVRIAVCTRTRRRWRRLRRQRAWDVRTTRLSDLGSGVINTCTSYIGYTGTDGHACSTCVEGQYKKATGSVTYTNCELDKFSTLTAASQPETCQSCPKNRWTSLTGKITIADCGTSAGSVQLITHKRGDSGRLEVWISQVMVWRVITWETSIMVHSVFHTTGPYLSDTCSRELILILLILWWFYYNRIKNGRVQDFIVTFFKNVRFYRDIFKIRYSLFYSTLENIRQIFFFLSFSLHFLGSLCRCPSVTGGRGFERHDTSKPSFSTSVEIGYLVVHADFKSFRFSCTWWSCASRSHTLCVDSSTSTETGS